MAPAFTFASDPTGTALHFCVRPCQSRGRCSGTLSSADSAGLTTWTLAAATLPGLAAVLVCCKRLNSNKGILRHWWPYCCVSQRNSEDGPTRESHSRPPAALAPHATPRSSKLSFEIREAGRPSFRGEHFYRCAVALRHDTVGVTPGGPPL